MWQISASIWSTETSCIELVNKPVTKYLNWTDTIMNWTYTIDSIIADECVQYWKPLFVIFLTRKLVVYVR